MVKKVRKFLCRIICVIFLNTANKSKKSKIYLTTIGACGEDHIHSLIVILIMYMKTAVIYSRVSSSTDRQTTTRQVNDLTSYAEFAKIRVLRVYEEKVSGAKKNSERLILQDCIDFSVQNMVDVVLISELSRLGRNTFELLSTVQKLMEAKINIYFQKEQFYLLDENKKPSLFTPILIAVLGTAAQLERENIQYRLNSGRAQYINSGGKLGRKTGSVKSKAKKEQEYAEVIKLLNKEYYTLKEIAKLSGVSISTVQRLKKEFAIR